VIYYNHKKILASDWTEQKQALRHFSCDRMFLNAHMHHCTRACFWLHWCSVSCIWLWQENTTVTKLNQNHRQNSYNATDYNTAYW